MPLHVLTYVTSSSYKQEENEIFARLCKLADGRLVSDCFSFRYESQSIPERLEIDLESLVKEEAFEAYKRIQVPCFVEHAGLIVLDLLDHKFPGGLTKAMWDALGPDFLSVTGFAGKKAAARACVGYCDGLRTLAFVGETEGILAAAPLGNREFYWDTVFQPDGCDRTYAQLVEEDGLERKVERLSQSTKAKLKFLHYILEETHAGLW